MPTPLAVELISKRADILVELALERGATWSQLTVGTAAEGSAMGAVKLCTVKDHGLLMRNVMKLFPDSDMALCWGSRVSLNARGSFGLAMMSMATLADVAAHVEQLREILQSSYRLSHEVVGDELWLKIDYPAAAKGSELARFNTEAMFASYVTLIATLLGVDGRALRVLMPGTAPVHSAAYPRYLARQSVFMADGYVLVYPASLLHMPIRGASRTLASHYLQEFNAALREAKACEGVALRVAQVLGARVGDYPDLPTVARSLGLGERSLRRRLAEDGAGFHQLLSQAKQAHAERLLGDLSLSVDAIASQLGFSDAANFRKAFRQWTQMSPAQWRARLS
ncbi:MAG: AraC family transcriptional regulator ligand-binding domain-containing protein [Aquabacterium sp.]|nr:AraC family transcriptional regulator ligand-binding domain-containing protein [Aquabacterium sp.]